MMSTLRLPTTGALGELVKHTDAECCVGLHVTSTPVVPAANMYPCAGCCPLRHHWLPAFTRLRPMSHRQVLGWCHTGGTPANPPW